MSWLTRRRAMASGLAATLTRPAAADVARATLAARPRGLTIAAGANTLIADALPALTWRYAGETAWRTDAPRGLSRVQRADSWISFEAAFGELRAGLEANDDGTAWQIGGGLRNEGARAVELLRYDHVAGAPTDTALGLIAPGSGGAHQFSKRGDARAPQNQATLKEWTDAHVRWSVVPDAIYDAQDWALSPDLAILAADFTAPGWTIGFTGPGGALGEIGWRTRGDPRLFVSQLLDAILLQPGETRPLEVARFWYGDWQDATRLWARACAEAAKVKPPAPAPAGYCSWYQSGSDIDLPTFRRAIAEVAALPAPPGGRVVQMDDGYQKTVGDWSAGPKFADVWAGMPGEIRATGSVPGTYIAPMMVHDDLPVWREHPEWFQRDPDGTPSIAFSNWGGRSVLLDPDHPGARQHMGKWFEQARDDGWEYIKIDFTYAIAPGRVAYNRTLTRFESERDLYRLCREAAGPKMRLAGSAGAGRYGLGSLDASRLYGDVSANWATVRDNMVPLMILMVVNGVWWQGDPDVFFMRRDKTQLTEEESWLLTGSIGLMGGFLVTSDLPSQWSDAARARVARFWTHAGPRAAKTQRIVFSPDGVPLAYRVSYPDGAPRHRIGLYNWTEAARDCRVTLRDAGLGEAGLALAPDAAADGIVLEAGVLTAAAQPPHSLRIADLIAR